MDSVNSIKNQGKKIRLPRYPKERNARRQSDPTGGHLVERKTILNKNERDTNYPIPTLYLF